jgi:hypothetical protein
MVVVITTVWIPYGKEKEFGQRYIEAVKKFPLDRSLEKSLLQAAARPTKDGFKAIGISQSKPGKYEEFLNRLNSMMLMFGIIEGLTYEIETFSDGVDAMKMVGLDLPDL